MEITNLCLVPELIEEIHWSPPFGHCKALQELELMDIPIHIEAPEGMLFIASTLNPARHSRNVTVWNRVLDMLASAPASTQKISVELTVPMLVGIDGLFQGEAKAAARKALLDDAQTLVQRELEGFDWRRLDELLTQKTRTGLKQMLWYYPASQSTWLSHYVVEMLVRSRDIIKFEPTVA